MRFFGAILALVYFLVGVLIASNHHYFTHASGIKGIASAILAVVLWPLILFGVDLHLGNAGGKGGAFLGMPSAWMAGSRPRRHGGVSSTARAGNHTRDDQGGVPWPERGARPRARRTRPSEG